MRLYFSRMNVRMMQPEREDQREQNKKKNTQQLRWRRREQASPAHSSSSPSYFFINPTPTITITPLAVTRNISADRPTCQKMTGIKYDMQSLCHHCREGHFPLEWNGGCCRAFLGGGTNTPNAAFESSYFHTAFREAPTALSGSRHRKMRTLMRWITSVWWLSRLLTDAPEAAFKIQINMPASWNHLL